MTNSSTNQTVHGLLARQVERYSDREFLLFEDQVFSFADLERESRQVAAGLQKSGIGKGDKVALMMGNRPEYLFTWFGLSMLGAIEVPLNTAHKGELLAYMVDKAECKLLIVDACYWQQIAEVLDNLPALKSAIVLDQDIGVSRIPTSRYETLINNSGDFDSPTITAQDAIAILFTSGTTGPSKGAVMPQRYPLFLAEMICGSVAYTEQDCLYNALPLFHGNAQFLSTIPALMSGARMVLARRFSASAFWNDIDRYQCTEFNYIGGILAILMKADPKPDDADNSLRVMMGGGASVDLFETFEQRFGVTLVEGYGMSEIGIPLQNSIDDRKPGSCGVVQPDYEVRLVDDEGRDVGNNVPGECLIRPRQPGSMMLEYYRMPEKTVEAWQDLWFHTGDYLMRDDDDHYHFIDRKKDALRRLGENISSYEVESIINSHPAVLESAAIAVPSELGEDEVMVCVTLKPDRQLNATELVRFCEEQMAYFMVPRYIRFLDQMPKTATERIQKYRLREQGVTEGTYDREAVIKKEAAK